MQTELTYDENEHPGVASIRIWRPDTDKIPNRNWNTATDDEHPAFPEFIGEVDLSDERNGTKDVDRDGHVINS